jgi:HSP20 family molecular chaperone IbpA
MFRRPDPADLMWAHACELIEEAQRMHRRFFRLASSGPAISWAPPADVFEDDREIVIVVAMPGVAADRVEISSEPGELVIRAHRPQPFAASPRAVRQVEIPYGNFERRIPLPQGRLEIASHELTHGCLVLRLSKAD